MNCCEENKPNIENTPNVIEESNNGKKHKSAMSHLMMMALCCGAPVLLVSLVPLISSIIPGAQGTIAKIAPFLCPILMLAMLPMLLRKHGGGNKEGNSSGMKQIESGHPE